METMSSEVENVRPQVEGGVAATHDLLLIVFIHGYVTPSDHIDVESVLD